MDLKNVIETLKYSWGAMLDEIAINEPISLNRYLIGIGISSHFKEEDRIKYLKDNIKELINIKLLLSKYHYDVPIVGFPAGENIMDILRCSKAKCITKKNRIYIYQNKTTFNLMRVVFIL